MVHSGLGAKPLYLHGQGGDAMDEAITLIQV